MAGSVVLELECGRRESIGGIVPLLTVPRTYEELYIKGCGAVPYAITNVAEYSQAMVIETEDRLHIRNVELGRVSQRCAVHGENRAIILAASATASNSD